MAGKGQNSRLQNFKNNGKDEDEMRRRRNEALVERRKGKREESLLKQRNVGNEDDDEKSIIQSSLEMIILKVKSVEPNEQISGVHEIGKVISSNDRNSFIDELLNNGLLPILIDFLKRNDNPALQYETACVLTILTSVTTAEVQESPLKPRNISNEGIDDGNSTSHLNLEVTVPKAEISEPVGVHEVIKLISKNRNSIIDNLIYSGMLPVLVKCLEREDNPTLQFEAACVLTNITAGTSAQVQEVFNSDAVPILLELLKSPHQKVCNQAFLALGNIKNQGPFQRDYVIQVGLVYLILDVIKPNYPLELLRNVISDILLINLKREDNPTLQLLAAFWLANITGGTSAEVQVVVNSDAVPILLELLKSPHQKVCQQALLALGNIINHSPLQRDYVIQLGLVNRLLDIINPVCPLELLRNITSVIVRLCRNDGLPLHTGTIMALMPTLCQLIHHTDHKVLFDTLWTFFYFTDGGIDQIQLVIDSGAVAGIVTLLSNKKSGVKILALRTVKNIVTWTDVQVQAVLDCHALDHFPALLHHRNMRIKKKALWILANIIGSNQEQIQAVIDAGLIPMVIHHLRKGEFRIQLKAALTLSILILCGTKAQVEYLASLDSQKWMAPLCSVMSDENPRVLHLTLEAFNNVLKTSGT